MPWMLMSNPSCGLTHWILIKFLSSCVQTSGVTTDFRVGWGGGGSGSWPEKLPTPKILFLLNFQPLCFADIQTTHFYKHSRKNTYLKQEISGGQPPQLLQMRGKGHPWPLSATPQVQTCYLQSTRFSQILCRPLLFIQCRPLLPNL